MAIGEEVFRIFRFAINSDFIMQMHAIRIACIAHRAYYVLSSNKISLADQYGGQMCINRFNAVGMFKLFRKRQAFDRKINQLYL